MVNTEHTKAAGLEHQVVQELKYPKHVWSPAGGWNSQPKNWKGNTAIVGLVIVGIAGLVFSISAEKEHRYHFPAPGRFYPSRYWSKEVIEHDKKLKEAGNQ